MMSELNWYLIGLLLLCGFVSYTDIRDRKIHNKVITVIFTFQVVFLWSSELNFDSLLAIWVTGLLAFKLRFIGAGDVKFAGILALGVPLSWLPQALILTAYSGGLLVFFYYCKHRLTPGSQIQNVTLPYGVAISVGFFVTIVNHQLQHQQLL